MSRERDIEIARALCEQEYGPVVEIVGVGDGHQAVARGESCPTCDRPQDVSALFADPPVYGCFEAADTVVEFRYQATEPLLAEDGYVIVPPGVYGALYGVRDGVASCWQS